jgi:spore maturation protein CgeB
MSGEPAIQWPRKVLVSYFFGRDTIPLGESVAQALEELGCEVARFDCRIEHRLQPVYKRLSRLLRPVLGRGFDLSKRFGHDNETVRNRALEDLANREHPDLLLVMRGNPFDGETLRCIKAATGCTTVSWCLYGPEALEATLRPDVGLYDHIFAVYRSGIPGVHALPIIARDDRLYGPWGPRAPFQHEVAFVGRRSPRRTDVIRELRGLPLSIWGPGWRSLGRGVPFWTLRHWRGSQVWQRDLVEVYRRSKILLNVSVWDPAKESGLNMRVIDVPACGGFLLTDHSDELAEYMTPGKEIETWRSVEELRDKVDFYLRNDAARERIAKAGLERAKSCPDFKSRVESLLSLSR